MKNYIFALCWLFSAASASAAGTMRPDTLSVKNNATVGGTTTSTGNFKVGSSGGTFNVTAASGNTTVSGTLGVTGVATLGSSTTVAHTIVGDATRGRELRLGNSNTFGAVGVSYAYGDSFLARNAYQATDNSNSWSQSTGGVGSGILTVGNTTGLAYYVAAIGKTSPDTFANFWGSSVFSVTSAGNGSFAGTLGVTGAATFSGGIKSPNLLIDDTAPTISSGFGTTPSIASNNGTAAFTVNVGTGGTASSGVIGLPTATTGWNCFCTDITTASSTVFMCKQTASSTTSATIGNFNTSGAAAAWVASDILRVSCFAY